MSHVVSLQLFFRMFKIHLLCNKPKPINSRFFLFAVASFSLNEIEFFFFLVSFTWYQSRFRNLIFFSSLSWKPNSGVKTKPE